MIVKRYWEEYELSMSDDEEHTLHQTFIDLERVKASNTDANGGPIKLVEAVGVGGESQCGIGDNDGIPTCLEDDPIAAL